MLPATDAKSANEAVHLAQKFSPKTIGGELNYADLFSCVENKQTPFSKSPPHYVRGVSFICWGSSLLYRLILRFQG